MRHPNQTLLALFFACSSLFAQDNPHERLGDALTLENQGQFDKALVITQQVLDSGQLSGVEIGRGYIMLGLAYQMTGRFPEAESAFQHSLSILKRDAENVSDYASALDNYAGLYFEAGRLVEAAAMRRKALDLQLRTGDHAAATRSLTNLAGVALAQKHLRESKEYLKKAFDQMALAPDLIEADFALFFETEACLALAEGHPAAAVADYQRALELTRRTHGDHHWLAGYEHMLLGKAYAQSGNIAWALAEMRLGLEILDSTLDRRNPKYFAAEIAYSDVLDRAGFHAKAAQLRTTAQRASKDFYRGQCVGCTINVAAFR